jgi:hypothetical protein
MSSAVAIKSQKSTGILITDLSSVVKKSKHNILINWIPSHIGVSGNDKADSVANQGIKHANIDVIMPYELVTQLSVESYICQQWQIFYNSATNGQFCKEVEPVVLSKDDVSEVVFRRHNRQKTHLI